MNHNDIAVHNWRDIVPRVGHESALIWDLLRAYDSDAPSSIGKMRTLSGFVKHAVQGRKISDRHSHADQEQVYYILKGTTTVFLDEIKYTVREGDIVYIPPKCIHHLLNDTNDDWVELLIISAPVTREASVPVVRNWRDQGPEVSHNAAVVWELLNSVDDSEAPEDRRRLLRMNYITRQAIQQGQVSDYHSHADQEQIYYILSGSGSVLLGEEMFRLRDGHVIYTPKDVPHKVINDGTENWIEYLIVSAKLELV